MRAVAVRACPGTVPGMRTTRKAIAAGLTLLTAATLVSACTTGSTTPDSSLPSASNVATFNPAAEPTGSSTPSPTGKPGSDVAVPAVGGETAASPSPTSSLVAVPRLDLAQQEPELRDFINDVNAVSVKLENSPQPESGQQVDDAYAAAWTALREADYGLRALIPKEWIEAGQDPDDPQPAFILAVTAPNGKEFCAIDVTFLPSAQQTPDELASDGKRSYPYLGLLDGSCDSYEWGEEAR